MFQHSQTLNGVAIEDEGLTNSAAVSNTVDGLILVTSSGVFRCQPKTSPEKLFLKLAVNSTDSSAADVLAITSGLDVNKLYEVGMLFLFVITVKQLSMIKTMQEWCIQWMTQANSEKRNPSAPISNGT